MPDRYDFHAQFVPAILYSASFSIIGLYFLSQIKTDVWGHILALGGGGVTVFSALFQLARHAGRFLGVKLQERTFQNGLSLPTTSFLLDNDATYSRDRKTEILSKISSGFGVDLTGRTVDTIPNRRRIHEVIGQVRKRYIKREMVQQRNIQYGFWRNLAGGSVIAVAVSLLSLLLSLALNMWAAFELSLVFLGGYVIVGVFAFLAMKLCARYYALALYDELLDDEVPKA